MMKHLYFTLLLLVSSSILVAQEETSQAQISDSQFEINSIGEPELIIDLALKLPEGYSLDDETFPQPGLTALLKSKKYAEMIDQGSTTVEISPAANNKIRFHVKGFSEKLSELIAKDDAGIYISTNEDINFIAIKGSETLKYTLPVADVEKYTSNKIVLTEAMEKELIEAKGGTIYMIENNFDFGVVPADDDEASDTEFYLSFKYGQPYSFLQDVPLFFYGEGLLSTDSRDSLNYLSLYPINFNLSKRVNRIVGQLGIEGNQRFTNYRVSGNVYWQGIIPNLVNLTFDEDRLRLKPVIKLGMKFYQEIENNRLIETDEEFSNQLFAEFYYYIPIKKVYSLILEGNTFYDFNDAVNPEEELKYNVTITLGVEIPKTDFKTIFKYKNGQNGISYQKDEMLMLGFMVDLFSID